MFNSKSLKFILTSVISVSFLFISGCGGGGGGGGGGDNSTLKVPANAVTINPANATDIANAAVSFLDILFSTVAAKAETAEPVIQDALKLVTNRVFDRSRRTFSIVTGVTESENCSSGGSITDTYTETASSYSGTVTFSNCIEEGVTINGSLSYSSTWNISTGAYSDSANGSINYVFGSESFTMALNFTDSGNENTGAYSTTVNFSISGISGGGFLLTTTQPISGIFDTVTAGQLTVQGAGNTRLRITITGSNSADVELDDGSGSFVYHSTINIP